MAQTTILGRVGQLLRANVNAMLDGAEDPEKMLDQLVRDFTNNMSEAEDAVAQTIGNLRMVQDDAAEAHAAEADWVNKAAAASKKARSTTTRVPEPGSRQIRGSAAKSATVRTPARGLGARTARTATNSSRR